MRTAEESTLLTERPLVVFALDDQRYALALARVQRCIRVVAITPLPEAPAIVLGIIDLGGGVIPVINIRKRFNHPPRDVRLSDYLIAATTGKRTVALRPWSNSRGRMTHHEGRSSPWRKTQW